MIFAMLRAMKPVVIVVLLLSFVAGPALPHRSWSGVAEASSHKIPPGQLTRKSLVGTVTAIASDGSSITIGTHFGNILVGVTGGTVVNAPSDKNVGIGAVSVGDKVVVKLDRSPLEKVEAPEEVDGDTAADTGTATTTDTGTATTTENGATTGDTGTATTTDTGATGVDNGTATTTDTGGTGGDSGTATTTDSGSATTTDTGFPIPGVASTEAVAVAIGVLDASNDREGLIGLGGYGIGGIALHGVVFQVATTTATTTAATTDTGAATDTGTATTTDSGAATTTDSGTSSGSGSATTTDSGAATTTDTAPPIFDPVPPDFDDLPPLRTVTASLITVIKSTRSHKRAIVTCETGDTLEVVGDDGTVVEFDDESTSGDPAATSTEPVAVAIASLEAYASGEGLVAVGGYGIGGIALRGIVLQVATTTVSSDGQTCEGSGDDLILLTQKKGRTSTKLVIKGKQSSDKIDERLLRIAEKLESSGKADRLEQFTTRTEERAENEAERLQRTLDRSDSGKKKDIEGALSKRKDLNDKPIKDRKPPRKDSGSSGGTGGSGGGGKGGDSSRGGGSSGGGSSSGGSSGGGSSGGSSSGGGRSGGGSSGGGSSGGGSSGGGSSGGGNSGGGNSGGGNSGGGKK